MEKNEIWIFVDLMTLPYYNIHSNSFVWELDDISVCEYKE